MSGDGFVWGKPTNGDPPRPKPRPNPHPKPPKPEFFSEKDFKL